MNPGGARFLTIIVKNHSPRRNYVSYVYARAHVTARARRPGRDFFCHFPLYFHILASFGLKWALEGSLALDKLFFNKMAWISPVLPLSLSF